MAEETKKGKRDGKERYGKSPAIKAKPTGSDGPEKKTEPTNDAAAAPKGDVMAGTDGVAVQERHASEHKEMGARHVTEMKDMHKRHAGEMAKMATRHAAEMKSGMMAGTGEGIEAPAGGDGEGTA